MKKVVSVLWMLMLALAVSVNFTSCGDDDEPEKKAEYEFLGSWELVSEDDPYMVVFKEDGTYKYKEETGTYTVAFEKIGEEEETVIICKNEKTDYEEKFIFEEVKGSELILYTVIKGDIGIVGESKGEKISFTKKL
jgi:hypothetical protein